MRMRSSTAIFSLLTCRDVIVTRADFVGLFHDAVGADAAGSLHLLLRAFAPSFTGYGVADVGCGALFVLRHTARRILAASQRLTARADCAFGPVAPLAASRLA